MWGRGPAWPPAALVSQLPRDTSPLCALGRGVRLLQGVAAEEGARKVTRALSPGEELGAEWGWIWVQRGFCPPSLDPAGCSESRFGVLAAGALPPGSPGAVFCPSSLSSSGGWSSITATNTISPGEGYPGASLRVQSPAHHPAVASWLQAPKPPASSSFLRVPILFLGLWVPLPEALTAGMASMA